MSAAVTTPVRRRLTRWHVLLLILLCVGAVAFLWARWRTARTQRLIGEIEAAGGWVAIGTTASSRLRDRVRGWSGEDPTSVRLARGTTPEWLRSWDDLTDLSIKLLKVDSGSDLGADLPRLVARHPLEEFYAPGVTGSDEIAAALSNSQTLRGVNLRDSDLTDAGLRALPLERIRQLNIAGTRITVDGLRELRRLPPIAMIVLDGLQVTDESVAILEQSPNPYRLWLYGPDATDDTVRTLKTALGTGGKHKVMSVYVGQVPDSRVSRSMVQEWMRDVPSVGIMYTRDAEPGPPLRSRGYTPRFWTRWFGR
jgi:hypothetical protein